MDMWQAIGNVSSPLTFVAFLAALVSRIYEGQLQRMAEEVRSSSGAQRDVLLGALSNVMRRADGDQAMAALTRQETRLKLAWFSFLIVALCLIGLSAFAYWGEHPERTVREMLQGEHKAAVIAALKSQKIYPITDAELPDALTTLVSLDARENALDRYGKWESKQVKIMAVPSLAELRRRAAKREEPFEPMGEQFRVGVPNIGPEQPARFHVYVGMKSPLAWQRLSITNPVTDRTLRVLAKPGIEEDSDVDLHLNYLQVRQLFNGNLPARTASVWVEVLQPGTLYDPACEPARKRGRALANAIRTKGPIRSSSCPRPAPFKAAHTYRRKT